MVDNLEISQKFDYQLKLIIVGDTGVGKSCILDRYLRDKYQ
jgi:GTPase SAR1 family protein